MKLSGRETSFVSQLKKSLLP